MIINLLPGPASLWTMDLKLFSNACNPCPKSFSALKATEPSLPGIYRVDRFRAFIMVEQEEHPWFWRIQSPERGKVTESYCLGCSAFVGASHSLVNLRLVELLHWAYCKEKPDAGPTPPRI